MKVTRELAELGVRTKHEDIPEPVRRMAKRAILDTLGVSLAGSAEEASKIL